LLKVALKHQKSNQKSKIVVWYVGTYT
jgi:hypothetical protein